MSLYTQGAGGFPATPQRERYRRPVSAGDFVPPVVMNVNQDSTFWTVIKWLGAGLTLWVGYEKVKELYDKKLSGNDDEEAEKDEV